MERYRTLRNLENFADFGDGLAARRLDQALALALAQQLTVRRAAQHRVLSGPANDARCGAVNRAGDQLAIGQGRRDVMLGRWAIPGERKAGEAPLAVGPTDRA